MLWTTSAVTLSVTWPSTDTISYRRPSESQIETLSVCVCECACVSVCLCISVYVFVCACVYVRVYQLSVVSVVISMRMVVSRSARLIAFSLVNPSPLSPSFSHPIPIRPFLPPLIVLLLSSHPLLLFSSHPLILSLLLSLLIILSSFSPL